MKLILISLMLFLVSAIIGYNMLAGLPVYPTVPALILWGAGLFIQGIAMGRSFNR